MSSMVELYPLIHSVAWKAPRNMMNALDCGCGRGRWGSFIRLDVKNDVYLVGLDIFLPNLLFCKKYGAYDDLVLADARDLPFKMEAFSMTIACEIIEHLAKEEGISFLKDLERVANGRIIISTPNIQLPQGAIYGNVYEIHRTRWSVGDFRKRGFKVRGIGMKFSIEKILNSVDTVLKYFLFPGWIFPRTSRLLCAYKDKEPPLEGERLNRS